MKNFVRIVVVLAGIAAGGTAWAQMKVEIQHSASTDYTPAIVAKSRGFFAKRGLDVNVIVSPNPGALFAAVASGNPQIATGTGTQLAAANGAGLDLVVIAGGAWQSRANPTISVVVGPNSTIKTPADFKGKKVISPGLNGALHVMFQKWLTENGVDPKSVTFLEQGFAQMGDMLKGGLADAALPVEPFRARMIQAGMARNFAGYFADIQDSTLVSFYFTTRKWAEANPKAVTDFREAMAEAIAFMKANPMGANQLASEHLKLPRQVVDSLPPPDLRLEVPAPALQFWMDLSRQFGLVDKPLDAVAMIVR
jgi:NitT/TauT family transport system substrate-binding protein